MLNYKSTKAHFKVNSNSTLIISVGEVIHCDLYDEQNSYIYGDIS